MGTCFCFTGDWCGGGYSFGGGDNLGSGGSFRGGRNFGGGGSFGGGRNFGGGTVTSYIFHKMLTSFSSSSSVLNCLRFSILA